MKSTVLEHIPELSCIEQVAWVNETAYRCVVPKTRMVGNTLLQDFLDEPNETLFYTPGRRILTWPLSANRPFDVAFGITEPGDVSMENWGYSVDIQTAVSHFQDFCPKIRELLRHTDRAVKWTSGEISPLETCKRDNGRVVLMGGAWHAMIPHSAPGENSPVEDAVPVVECLELSWQQHHTRGFNMHTAIAQATGNLGWKGMQIASQEGYTFLSASGEDDVRRNQALAAAVQCYDSELAVPEEVRPLRERVPADIHCKVFLEP